MTTRFLDKPLSSTYGQHILALDFQGDGIRASISVGKDILPLNLSNLGLSKRLISVDDSHILNRGFPVFFNLIDVLGKPGRMALDDYSSDKPFNHLCNILQEISEPLRFEWHPLNVLCLVVSGFATSPQRSQLIKAAQFAGWSESNIHLINKTTAISFETLQARPSGVYLILSLGYEAAEASLVRWEANRLKITRHEIAEQVSGSQLDLKLLQMITKSLAQSQNQLQMEFYELQEWYWILDRLSLLRHRLNCHNSVSWEIPAAFTQKEKATTIEIQKTDWEEALAPICQQLAQIIKQCCQEGKVELEQLQGCIVSGSLLFQKPIIFTLQKICQDIPLSLYSPDTQSIGACRLIARQESSKQTEAEEIYTTSPVSSTFFLASPSPKIVESSVKAEIQSKPISEDDTQKVRSQLSKTEATSSRESQKTPHDESEQRKKALASAYLKQAEQELKRGNLAQAVAFSHYADEESKDGKIFRSAINIHLKAASHRPPTIQNFEEQSMWLLCAMSHDFTNEEIQEAVTKRFLTHARQLIELEKLIAAKETLEKLNQHISLEGEAQQLLEKLNKKAI